MNNKIGDRKVIDQLEKDVMAFFLDRLSGHLWPYLYGTPEHDNDLVRGGILYNEMLEGEHDYYLYKYEAALFQSKRHFLASIIGPNATFIELGPGSEQSIGKKRYRCCERVLTWRVTWELIFPKILWIKSLR